MPLVSKFESVQEPLIWVFASREPALALADGRKASTIRHDTSTARAAFDPIMVPGARCGRTDE
jgi:hypothetical protein